MKRNLELAVLAAIEAGKAILEIYGLPKILIENKEDNSPLTAADKASNKCIIEYLKKTGIPIISEENKQVDYQIRKNWKTFWMIDPLDGTKEFIKRNGEFTVNIALCENGIPFLGVIYVPVTKELYYADVTIGKAYKTILTNEHCFVNGMFNEADAISPSIPEANTIRVVGSRSHMNEETLGFINNLRKKYGEVAIVSKGSSLKFCLVAEGKADIYPRFAPTMEWDTAAGQAICTALGIHVRVKDSKEELRYNKENLLNSYFLVGK
jgi:3'(2'), 5'-bisphosphate nucleotidase